MIVPLLALVWQTNQTDQPLRSRYHIPVLATWYICSRKMREKYKLKACYC